MIKCSWDLCKYNKDGKCQHLNGNKYNIDSSYIKVNKDNMSNCKLYSSKEN